ncbi:hypothetical protein [Roseospira navarrensis]|uniref:Uncharacterized protein n=1 Tax=Roseospira navarrensis TaxID=140058 RepID=A0A7X1ZHA4_9PROT|nr:hypothetical protein [Roseospira navarrensis]MQX38501.1 hypothetical protein [Roseospira navarrensis]
MRNEIGHEIMSLLVDDDRKEVTLYDVVFSFSVYVKVSQWWFREFEAAIDPDMTQEKYDSICWDEVQNVETIMLREILNKSLCDNDEWKAILGWVEEMQKNI